jgi:demethylspheroidene O-methyltransferase
MTDLPLGAEPKARRSGLGWLTRLALSPKFHAISQVIPGLRGISRREGQALFDTLSGFVQSQALMALVELDVLTALRKGPLRTAALAHSAGVAPDRMAILMQSAAALKLVRRGRDDDWHLAPRGAAFLTVPGLAAMVRHHRVLYRDLADPTAFLRGETTPELAGFWPYVFGAGAAADPETAATYSQLMADSQGLVAADTLAAVDFSGVRNLMDVGGGTGAFLTAVGQAEPGPQLTLFDLPAVVPGAMTRFAHAGLTARTRILSGSFRDDPLPQGADAISLIRVLYDHADSTVAALLSAVHTALPPGGRLVISEPMSGGQSPDRATDVYFAFYTLAMGTGRTRSSAEIGNMLQNAGFGDIRINPSARPYVTQVVTATKV